MIRMTGEFLFCFVSSVKGDRFKSSLCNRMNDRCWSELLEGIIAFSVMGKAGGRSSFGGVEP